LFRFREKLQGGICTAFCPYGWEVFMKYGYLLIALFLILLIFTANAQPVRNVVAPSAAEGQKNRKELEKKALGMLDEMLQSIPSFKLPENRLRLTAKAASLLWPHHQKRASQLFTEIASEFSRLLSLPEDSPEALPEQAQWQLQGLRSEISQIMVQCDPQLALDFIRATRPSSEAAMPGYSKEAEASLEINLAFQIAQKDPRRALQLAEEKLAAGQNPGQFCGLLSSLHAQDAPAAQKLLGSIINRLRKDTWSFDNGLPYFALELLYQAAPPDDEGRGAVPTDAPKPLISAVIARELIEKALAVAQAEMVASEREKTFEGRNNALNLLTQLHSMMPYVEKYASSSAAAIKRAVEDHPLPEDPGQAVWNQLEKLAEAGNVQGIMEAATTATEEQRFNFHQRAAQLAQQQGNHDLARRIITESVTNVAQRRQMLDELDREKLYQALNENKFDEARSLTLRLRNISERTRALIQIAAKVLAENPQDRETQNRAAGFLEEAWSMTGGSLESNQQMTMQLQVATAFMQFNHQRSFEIMEALLGRLNEIIAASVIVEGFEQNGSVRSGEILINTGRSYSLGIEYSQPLSLLALMDFDRTQVITSQIARPELRSLICLQIIETFLMQTMTAPPVANGGGISIGHNH
jgi:hypothetical protein